MLSRICTLIPFVARTKGLLLAVRLLRIVDGIVTMKLRTQSARLVVSNIETDGETMDAIARPRSVLLVVRLYLRIVDGVATRRIGLMSHAAQLLDFQIASEGGEEEMNVGVVADGGAIGRLLIVLTEKRNELQNQFLILKVLISLLSER
jgi:hypothetical protein